MKNPGRCVPLPECPVKFHFLLVMISQVNFSADTNEMDEMNVEVNCVPLVDLSEGLTKYVAT